MRGSSGGVLAGVAVLLLLHAAIVLGGVYVMLNSFGEQLDSELDSQVDRVTRDFEKDLDAIREDVRKELREELDSRVPLAP